MTIAGSDHEGRGLNQLNTPYGFDVDDDQSLYIADTYNHRIVAWRPGKRTGEVIFGGSGQGCLANQLNYPTDVIINKTNGSLIICDRGNKRILQCSRENGGNEQTIFQHIDCFGLTMNKNGYIYVTSYNNHEVRRFKLGETTGTIVAGGNCRGHHLNQLDFPTYLFVDDENAIYVSDSHNNRIMKWEEGANKGVIVAGGHGEGNDPTQLHNPHGIFVNRLETVYVADTNNNRVVCWPKGATHSIIVVGGNDPGKRPNQLQNPTSLSFDRNGHLYVADSRNHRVQRFNC
jgi:sugar lactone lactonase YvrE